MKFASFKINGTASWGLVDGTDIADVGALLRDRFADLKSAIGGEDSAQIEARSHALTQASTKLGEAVSAASQGQTGSAGRRGWEISQSFLEERISPYFRRR